MNAIADLDPNLSLPLWQALVNYFRRHPPLVQADPRLPVADDTRLVTRVWHGWTRPEKADAFEAVLREQAMPAIRARAIPGLRGLQLTRREQGDEVEFITEMWFDDLKAVKDFAGEDYTRASLLPEAHALLSRYDSRAQHYEVRMAK